MRSNSKRSQILGIVVTYKTIRNITKREYCHEQKTNDYKTKNITKNIYQVYKYEMTIFFPKKHVKFGRMIKRDLFKVCSIASYIFPIFRAICGYYASKNLPLLPRTIHRAIFSYLRTNQSSANA